MAPPAPESIDAPIGLVIGADSLLRRRSGIGRMTLEIAEAVRHRPEIATLRLLMEGRLHATEPVLARLTASEAPAPPGPPAVPGLLRRVKIQIGGIPGVQRLRAARRRWAQRRDMADMAAAAQGRVVYHEPNMIPQPSDCPTVVCVNDLSWHHHPEYHPAERLAWIDRNLRRTLDQATRFVAISRFTADAMVRDLGVDAARIDVVALAAGAQFVPMDSAAAAPALARHGLQDRGYVLSVSTLEPRKNFDRLMAAHLALPLSLRRRFPLAIVGGAGWGSTLASPGAERARQDGTLRLLGHVADQDLVPLYARAALFAYVSVYEGFGLPLLEAMAAGTPVVASATTATGETAGTAALLVDPLDVDAIAAGLRRVLEDPALAERLRTQGLVHAAGFTWDGTATTLIRSWRRALD